MKKIKKYNNFLDQDFNVGDFVKLTDNAINHFIASVKKSPNEYIESYRIIEKDDLKNKFFEIIKYDQFYTGINYEPAPYKIKNLNTLDNFDWGWTNIDKIRHLTKEELKQLELLLNVKKYNL